jgi:prepilin-type N-terminal cleavage/methylation domain-containing protein
MRNSGFTLMEMLVVMALVGIVLSLVAGSFGHGRPGLCQQLCG